MDDGRLDHGISLVALDLLEIILQILKLQREARKLPGLSSDATSASTLSFAKEATSVLRAAAMARSRGNSLSSPTEVKYSRTPRQWPFSSVEFRSATMYR